MSRVTLSYFADGTDSAQRLRGTLAQAGLELAQDIDHRTEGAATAITLIGQSRAVIVVLTPMVTQSAVLRDELRLARQQGKLIAIVQVNSPPLAWEGPGIVYDFQTDLPRLIHDMSHLSAVDRAPNTAPALPDTYVQRVDLVMDITQAVLTCAQIPSSLRGIWRSPGNYVPGSFPSAR